MEFSVKPNDTMYWVAFYVDGSYDTEGEGRKYPELPFNQIEHFTALPKIGSPHNIAICIIKPIGYRLIWRKQRHITTMGEDKGTDYQLGLEPDNEANKELLDKVERGEMGIEHIYKNSSDGFRIWLTKDGEIRTAGAFNKTDEIKEYEGEQIRYITCEILK